MSKKYSLSSKEPPKPSLPDPWERAIRSVSEERSKPASKLSLFDLSFPKQNEFIKSPARKKALWCTRRAAKSFTGGLYLCDTVETFHEVNCLYLGLTKDSAMGIIWNDILKKINRDHSLELDFRESKRDVTSKTGSHIYISGADSDAEEMHKLLGRKYKLIVIDEAQSYGVDMRTLVYGILGPTLVDVGGTICMLGTSGNLTQGLFFDVTNGKEAGWELFQWTAHDNPYVARQWQEELDDIEKTRPAFKETNLFKQWYLNQWCIDEDAKVYRFSAARNLAPCLPPDLSDWHYILGLDLAHSPDSTAFVVGAYNDASPTLYMVYAHKQTQMDITDVALFIKELEKKYNFDVKVVDGANKQAVAELNNRHELNLIPADKVGKTDFITLMNDDFIQGKIKCLPATAAVQEEWGKLIWLTDANGKVKEPRRENPAIHQDLSDAALYLWRYCYQFLFKLAAVPLDKSRQDVWEPAHIAKLQEAVRKEQNPTPLDDLSVDWDEVFEDDAA